MAVEPSKRGGKVSGRHVNESGLREAARLKMDPAKAACAASGEMARSTRTV
jgi:hypothetical protein